MSADSFEPIELSPEQQALADQMADALAAVDVHLELAGMGRAVCLRPTATQITTDPSQVTCLPCRQVIEDVPYYRASR